MPLQNPALLTFKLPDIFLLGNDGKLRYHFMSIKQMESRSHRSIQLEFFLDESPPRRYLRIHIKIPLGFLVLMF